MQDELNRMRRHGMSYAQIAEATGLSRNAVAGRFERQERRKRRIGEVMPDEDKTDTERERYEKVRARVGIGSYSPEQRFRERNAVAASSAQFHKPAKNPRFGKWSFTEGRR